MNLGKILPTTNCLGNHYQGRPSPVKRVALIRKKELWVGKKTLMSFEFVCC